MKYWMTMYRSPESRRAQQHRPLFPPPKGPGPPSIVFASIPAAFVVAVSFLGTWFGELVPTNATLAMLGFWAPMTVLTVAGLTALIAAHCQPPIILMKVGVVALATLLTWLAAPGFISYGLPAIIADRNERIPAKHVVEVVDAVPVCGATRGARSGLFGAVVRSDLLGGPSGSTICRIPPSVWQGLRPGDRLTLHGYQGRFAFHYDQITR